MPIDTIIVIIAIVGAWGLLGATLAWASDATAGCLTQISSRKRPRLYWFASSRAGQMEDTYPAEPVLSRQWNGLAVLLPRQ
jgi:hypothetical protein